MLFTTEPALQPFYIVLLSYMAKTVPTRDLTAMLQQTLLSNCSCFRIEGLAIRTQPTSNEQWIHVLTKQVSPEGLKEEIPHSQVRTGSYPNPENQCEAVQCQQNNHSLHWRSVRQSRLTSASAGKTVQLHQEQRELVAF